MYERAITTILKANMLNHFAYADFEEVSGSSTAFYQVLHLVDALVMFLKFFKCSSNVFKFSVSNRFSLKSC